MKLLIADDEEYTRESIRQAFEWETLGVREVMLARDGKDALAIARWFQPDLVVTDIKMPRLDGIAFAQELIKFLPECKLLFISGYVETEYFKNALRLSAVDYVLKPIDKAQFLDAIQRAIAGIEQTRSYQRIQDANLQMKRNKLMHLLLSQQPDMAWCERLCAEVDFPRQGEFLCVSVRQLGRRWYSQAVCESVEALCKAQDGAYLVDYLNEDCYVAVLQNPEPFRFKRACMRLLENEQLLIGIGVHVKGLIAINRSYQAARHAQELHFFFPDKRIIDQADLPSAYRALDPGIQSQFLFALREHPQELAGWFRELFESIEAYPGQYRRGSIRQMFGALMQSLMTEHPELLARLSGLNQADDLRARLEGMDTWQEMRGCIEAILEILGEELARFSQYSRVVQRILKYVDERYGDCELTIQEIADHFRISTTYIGILFKRETHVTLKQHINRCRINKAKKLLREGNDKIIDIADMCGFANANYFAHIFKESEGVTPQEYRKCP